MAEMRSMTARSKSGLGTSYLIIRASSRSGDARLFVHLGEDGARPHDLLLTRVEVGVGEGHPLADPLDVHPRLHPVPYPRAPDEVGLEARRDERDGLLLR